MDHIVHALQRAKETFTPPAERRRDAKPPAESPALRIPDVEVSPLHLESVRVIAHDAADPRSRSFDLLRTQILQEMDRNDWRILAVTSPTPACGKTFTAVNLALSIARQPDSAVMLVDLDVKKPQIAHRLGIGANTGLRAVLEGRASLEEATLQVSAAGARFRFLPCERASSRSSDWLSSSAMIATLQSMRASHGAKLVILDLPPMLAGDEVVSLLPHVDCVLMVAAIGTTTTAELRECANFMRSTPLLRVVLNKVPEVPAGHYY